MDNTDRNSAMAGGHQGRADQLRAAASDEAALRRAVCIAMGTGVELVAWKTNPHASTFPSLMLECLDAAGRSFQLFAKSSNEDRNEAHGHRGGLGYEAEVYRDVLAPLRSSAPRIKGTARDETTGHQWLFIELVEGAVQLGKSENSLALEWAARWAGQFHATSMAWLQAGARPKLHRYERSYFTGWVQRALELAEEHFADSAWFPELCGRFAEDLDELLGAPASVIHGEYYGNNILLSKGVVSPVDWESAAIAPGEIDLAMLTDGWSDTTSAVCERAYYDARGSVEDRPSLNLARVYVHLRWLGERKRREVYSGQRWRMNALRGLLDRWGAP